VLIVQILCYAVNTHQGKYSNFIGGAVELMQQMFNSNFVRYTRTCNNSNSLVLKLVQQTWIIQISLVKILVVAQQMHMGQILGINAIMQ
jgi:hypothetical protein